MQGTPIPTPEVVEVIGLTPLNGFAPYDTPAQQSNTLTILSNGLAIIDLGVTNATVPAVGTVIFTWSGYPAWQQFIGPNLFSEGDTVRPYILKGESSLRFQRLTGSATAVLLVNMCLFWWKEPGT